MKLKAFTIKDNTGECVNELVYHYTANKAKYFAMNNSLWFEDSEWIDLTARREKKAENLVDTKDKKPFILDFCENTEIFKKLGWYCIETSMCDEIDCIMY